MFARVTTLDDPRVREYQHVADPQAIERAGLFVAEGRWVVERLLARPHYRTRSVLVTPPARAALAKPLGEAALRDVPVYVVDQALLDQIVGFNIHRGCLALAERPVISVLSPEIVTDVRRVVVLEGVNNPDNVGGIFRSAAAFDVDLIVLGPACGDPLYRKAIRTSMAATLEVPYARAPRWPDALDLLRAAGLRVLALTPDSEATPLAAVDTASRLALVLGAEGTGLTAEARARADDRVRIRTSTRVDSLNVTVAASIAMHHCFRD